MDVKAKAPTTKDCMSKVVGKLDLKAHCPDEQVFLSELFGCLMLGGVVTVKRGKRKSYKIEFKEMP